MTEITALSPAATLTGSELLALYQGSGAVNLTTLRAVTEVLALAQPVTFNNSFKVNGSGGAVTVAGSSPFYAFGADLSGATPGYIQYVTSSGAMLFVAGSAERMRFDGSGNVLTGGATASTFFGSTAGFMVAPTGNFLATRSHGYVMALARTGSDGTLVEWYRGATLVGSVGVTTTGTTYNTTSDYRLPWKAGAIELADSGAFIDGLKPMFFPLAGQAGFFAHEFQLVSPASVSGTKDAVDGEGNPIYQSMQASSPEVMANIIAELQSLRARVAELEAA